MRIAGCKTNPIESRYFIDSIEKFSKRSFYTLLRKEAGGNIPFEFFTIPKFFLRFFSITIYILSEKSDFLGSICYAFLDFLYDFSLWSRFFASPGIGNDTKTTEIITSCLDNNIGRTGIILRLFDLKIFVPFGIIADFCPSNE